jgi:hypothetical protein
MLSNLPWKFQTSFWTFSLILDLNFIIFPNWLFPSYLRMSLFIFDETFAE